LSHVLKTFAEDPGLKADWQRNLRPIYNDMRGAKSNDLRRGASSVGSGKERLFMVLLGRRTEGREARGGGVQDWKSGRNSTLITGRESKTLQTSRWMTRVGESPCRHRALHQRRGLSNSRRKTTYYNTPEGRPRGRRC